MMADPSIALSASVQAGLQSGLLALKSALQSVSAVVNLVTQAVDAGKSSQLSAPKTDSSRALDVIV